MTADWLLAMPFVVAIIIGLIVAFEDCATKPGNR
jgi:hypothetical protein